MKKAFLLSCCILFAASALFAQRLNRVQGDILVRLDKRTNPSEWIVQWQTFEGVPILARFDRVVSKPLNIWLMTFDYTTIDERKLLDAVRRHPGVVTAQFNHLVTMRSTIPDDPGFEDQWQYINTGQTGGLVGADIDADLAWDITTGGLTATGDTIVVAILDDGIDLNHQDFGDNRWFNHAEIPNNGIDDDDNGYIDDYRGWNILSDTDNISGGGHGTPVAGIVGAQGNNGIGVAGVNWDVKLMIVKNNFNSNEALVLEAYTYPLVQRMRYNASNGAEGAFVVATNASWGTDFGDPEDAPLWCAFFDTLGVNGIISCGATANGNINVDEQGDLPTACPSDYLISVTNMNHNDVKVTGAGYGATTIDLGAFGANTWTTAQNNGYNGFGGTSGATPHVTGTVGLLYSAPCPGFMALAKNDPGAAALLVKQAILEGVDFNPSLDSITVTGGRLNVFKSLTNLLVNCGGCFSPSSQKITALSDTAAVLTWNINDSIQRVDLRWRAIGAADWNEADSVGSPYEFEGLLACTDYELQLRAFCSSDTLDYGLTLRFKTDGCCEAPGLFSIDAVGDSTAAFSWSSVLAATGYQIQINVAGSGVFTQFDTQGTEFDLPEGLLACTEYEVQIKTLCENGTTDFGTIFSFGTTGCGPCRDFTYCPPIDLNASEEWIQEVVIDTFQLISGSDESYGNFTTIPGIVLEQGGAYPMLLIPGYAGFSFQEYFKIWIDYGKDGIFDDNELVFDAGSTVSDTLSAILNIAADAPLGSTRLRVLMQYQEASGACISGADNYGEVEDYCVEILPAANCRPPSALEAIDLTEHTAGITWEAIGPAIGYILHYKKQGADVWTAESVLENFLLLENLDSCQTYEVQLQSVCSADLSILSDTLRFSTDCINSTGNAPAMLGTLAVQPNPFQTKLRLTLTTPAAQNLVLLEVLTPFGQRIEQRYLENLNPGKHVVEFDLASLPSGVYWVRLRGESGVMVAKQVVKVR